MVRDTVREREIAKRVYEGLDNSGYAEVFFSVFINCRQFFLEKDLDLLYTSFFVNMIKKILCRGK